MRPFDPENDLPPDGASFTRIEHGISYTLRYSASTNLWEVTEGPEGTKGRVARPFSPEGMRIAKLYQQQLEEPDDA